ncbi:MAG: hypothetical protein KDM81_19245, partial [Verrucomicrobiae bacterium]|nr:hypothetical protein [Verrucomicrobiae bacterium]
MVFPGQGFDLVLVFLDFTHEVGGVHDGHLGLRVLHGQAGFLVFEFLDVIEQRLFRLARFAAFLQALAGLGQFAAQRIHLVLEIHGL